MQVFIRLYLETFCTFGNFQNKSGDGAFKNSFEIIKQENKTKMHISILK